MASFSKPLSLLLAPWCQVPAYNHQSPETLTDEAKLLNWTGFQLTNKLALYTKLRLKTLPHEADLGLSTLPGSKHAQFLYNKQDTALLVVGGYHHSAELSSGRVLRFKLLDLAKKQLLSQWDFDLKGRLSSASPDDEALFNQSKALSDGLGKWLLDCVQLDESDNSFLWPEGSIVNNSQGLEKLINAEVLSNQDYSLESRMALYEEVIAQQPEQETALLNLAKLKQGKQEYRQALSYYQQLVQTSRALPSIKAYYANEAGICQAILKNSEAAQHFWRQAIGLQPSFLLPYLNLAHLLEEENQLEEAEALFVKAQEIKSSDPRTAYSLARIYSKTSQWEKALIQYQYQLDADKNGHPDPWCYSNIANCYLQLQRTREAELHFKKTVQLDANGEAGEYAAFVLAQLKQAV